MAIKPLLSAVAIALLLTPATARAQDEVVYYHTDAVGSVRMITDASGAVIGRYDYLPFGELWPAVPPGPTDARQFAGKERDTETGLDYFGARYFRAQSGRFTTVDPVLDAEAAFVDPQRWNRYAYARNNPFRNTDPDGRDPRVLGGVIGTVVYAAWNSYVNVQQGRPWYENIGVEASKGFVVGATLGLAAPALGARSLAGLGTSAAEGTGAAITRALQSTDPAIRFEGETGQFLSGRNLLQAFNVTIGGRQIDAVAGRTQQFVIEMTTGTGRGKLAQAAAQAQATGLEVIIYGQNLSQGFVKEALRQGYRVARSPEELAKLLF